MAKQNFRVYYEVDGETIGTVLRADEYDGSDEFSWVLLEAGRWRHETALLYKV